MPGQPIGQSEISWQMQTMGQTQETALCVLVSVAMETANKETVGRLYAQLIGYDPFIDSPEITESEVRQTLAGYFDIVLSA